MNLSTSHFFGPQQFLSDIVTYPPYSERLLITRYGYETHKIIYDVCIPPVPIGPERITRWYKTNGRTSLIPTPIHVAIEKFYKL